MGDERRKPDWTTIAISAAVTLAVGVAVVGASIWAVRQELHESRAAVTRDQRTEVYFRLLNTANDLVYAAEDVPKSCGPGLGTYDRSRRCRVAYSDALDARRAFRGALNRVYVFGSEDGLTTTQEIAQLLPSDLSGASDAFDDPVDFGAFNAAYRELLETACKETPPEPRGRC